MAWIELHDTLPDHPKTLATSLALKIDKDLLVGKLCRLWTWCLNNRENGFIADYEVGTVAEVMRWTKNPMTLMGALCAVPSNYIYGFFERVDGGYVIHDWDERVEMLQESREKKRAQARERVRKHRAKKDTGGDECNAPSNTDVTPDVTHLNDECNALHERYVTHDVTQCYAATVPNRTVPSIRSSRRTCAREDSDPPGDLVAFCQANLPTMNAAALDELRDFLDKGITPEMVELAVNTARSNGSMAWSYARAIMDSWVVGGITTLDAAKTHMAQHKSKRQGQARAPDIRGENPYVAPDYQPLDPAVNPFR